MDTFFDLKKKRLDLAFLFSDPLVEINEKGEFVPVSEPLDIYTEFKHMVNSLYETEKT